MRLKWAMLVVALCVVVTVAAVAYAAGKATAEVADVIRAQRCEVVDSDNVTRATLGPWPDGTSGLRLMDIDGNQVVALMVDLDGSSGLVLTESELQAGVKAVVVRGKPELKLRDSEGKAIWEAP